ncbi:hypothetical protein ABH225_001158 [Shigella flexneri]
MATYYRLYITTFETSTGIKIYGGKHKSVYEDPSKDPYTGSGTFIRRAKRKYGPSCIKEIIWSKPFESKALMDEAEELLVDELSILENCANLVKGGAGGRSYINPEDNPSIGQKRSAQSKKKMSDAAKSRKWTEEGLRKRKESTARMWKDFKHRHPDFSGSKNPAARKVSVNGKIFNTCKECGEEFNITSSAVIGRCKNNKPKWSGWNYVDV